MNPVYVPNIAVDDIDALDVHTHVESDGCGNFALDNELLDASAQFFGSEDNRTPTVDQLASYYRERNMAAVVFTVDASTGLGHPALSSEDIATEAAQHSDVLIPFGSVDPHATDAVERAATLATHYGVRGMKFHPSLQEFEPNDRAFYPLFEVLQEHGVIALFHTGQTGIGGGLPGGRGIKMRYSNPTLLDDVAADFPDLQIIMAHPAVPWVDAAISTATHKANAYIDLSGWSPKYFPSQLVRQANTLLKHKVLFGSDYPVINPDRWMKAFAQLDMKDEVRPMIMKENAVKLLGLA